MDEQTNTSNTNGDNDLVTSLVGEGKKFKTVEDLAKGKVAADTFIQQLQLENKALREAMDNGDDTAGIMTRINELLSKKDERTATNQTSNQSQPESLTKEEVLDLLNRRDQDKTLRHNSDLFKNAITKALGDKADETVATRLQSLGLDKELFDTMVARSPQSALSLIGIKDTVSNATSGKDVTLNTEAYFANSDNSKQNFAHFQKLRKELGAKYYEPEIQKQVFEARKRLGDAFWK